MTEESNPMHRLAVVVEHEGYTIYVDKVNGFFKAWKDGEEKIGDSDLMTLRNRISKAVQRRSKLKDKRFPIEFYRTGLGRHLMSGKITSVADDGEVWVSYILPNGETKREKCGRWDDGYPVNGETTQAYNQIKVYNDQIEGLEKLIRKELDKIYKYKAKLTKLAEIDE